MRGKVGSELFLSLNALVGEAGLAARLAAKPEMGGAEPPWLCSKADPHDELLHCTSSDEVPSVGLWRPLQEPQEQEPAFTGSG